LGSTAHRDLERTVVGTSNPESFSDPAVPVGNVPSAAPASTVKDT
jgi:hypothetical protein